jgi:hypothetical protein
MFLPLALISRGQQDQCGFDQQSSETFLLAYPPRSRVPYISCIQSRTSGLTVKPALNRLKPALNMVYWSWSTFKKSNQSQWILPIDIQKNPDVGAKHKN